MGKSSTRSPPVNGNITPIAVARRFHREGLLYFTPALVADLFSLSRRRAYRIIARLVAVGLADEIEKGKYLLLGLEPEHLLSNPLYIGSHIVSPAYISYWSALHFYGFCPLVPRTTFVATTKKKRPVAYRNLHFRFVTVKPHKLFGYRREQVSGLPVVVADEAKAIVDSFDLSTYAGGIIEVAEALRLALARAATPAVDVGTLVEYANRMQNRSLGSRLGFLLELLGHEAEGLVPSDSTIKLDPSRPRVGNAVTRWRVVVNVPEAVIAGLRATP
jgi:predicted transcriptional regulator of viral defense system